MPSEATGVCILTRICDDQEHDDAHAPPAAGRGPEDSVNCCHSPVSRMRLPVACAGEQREQSQRKAERSGAAAAAGTQVRATMEVAHLSAVAPGGQLANEHEEDPFFFLSLRLPVPEPVDRDFFRPLVRGS